MLAVTAYSRAGFDSVTTLPLGTQEVREIDLRRLSGRPQVLCLSGPLEPSLAVLWHAELANAFLRWACERGSASQTSGIEAAFSFAWRKGIKIPNANEVRGYLLRHSDMTDVVVQLCDMASRRLGPGAQLSLEVYHDPEIEDEYLTLYVRQERYDQRILDAIEDLCQACERQLAGRSGWLLVTTDFASPM